MGLIWLASDVQRLRARVLELEGRTRSAADSVVPAEAEASVREGSVAVAGGEVVSSTHRGSRVRGNDGESGGRSENGLGAWERLVGGRLLIWVGGIALALAGLFLVRYSIEFGLIGPGVQMALAGLLGACLVAAGEWARARIADDPRVAQALVGAGVLILYAAAYGSHVLYGLIGAGTAFALMAAVAGAGLFLALRHGWPVAALGLIGALAAPALVNLAGEVLPLLGYLLLINLAVLFAVRARSWGPLLGPAVLGTAAWTIPLCVSSEGFEVLAVGVFVLGYGVAAATLLGAGAKQARQPDAGLPASLGLVQLGLLTAAENFFLPGWLLYGTLAGAVLWLSRADRLTWAPAGAAAGAIGLLGWQMAFGATTSPSPWLIAAGALLLFVPASWWRGARAEGRPVWAATLAIALLGTALALRAGAGADLSRSGWGLALLALALPALAMWARVAGRGTDGRPAALAATAATLAGLACADLFNPLWLPASLALLALLLAAAGARREEVGTARVAGATGAVALLGSAARILPALGGAAWPGAGEATAALAVPAVLIAGAAWLTREAGVRRFLWAGAGLAGLTWGLVLARQLSGLARVLSFLTLGVLLIVAGRVWSRRRSVSPA